MSIQEGYLLVGRVSKIQTFIAQSARLRQVIGASYLVMQFDDWVNDTVPTKYGGERLLSGGGNFRLKFETEAAAQSAEAAIQARFAETIGGKLAMVIVPDDEHATDIIREKLGEVAAAPIPLWHSPYHAICASCGVENAIAYDNEDGYICANCQRKHDASNFEERRALFRGLLDALNDSERHEDARIMLPERDVTDAESYAEGWDDRQYVAYMVADGNSMGEIFGKLRELGQTQVQSVSDALAGIVNAALADAVEGMVAFGKMDPPEMPVLPLIIGGDDVFVLMPARWAFDVAKRFAASYERRMTDKLHEVGINDIRATIGVGVVVAKSSYPYKVIFRHGHEILEQAKDRAKELVKATELPETLADTPYRSAIIVDWLVGSATQSEIEPQVYNLAEVDVLLEQRFVLRELPNNVRHRFFKTLGDEEGTALKDFLRHIKRGSARQHHALRTAKDAFDDPTKLRQLLHCWDFAYDLQIDPDEYEREGVFA